jgi:pimeloyl-ACP methyl ester carboxylesterase
MNEYKWNKVSLIGHSMCSRLVYVYASLFADKVDVVIGFDNLKPLTLQLHQFKALVNAQLSYYSIVGKRSKDSSEPPAYTIEEMISRTVDGTNGSVTMECVPYLLKRNIIPSKRQPGKFCFSRDGRLKYSTFPYTNLELSLEMADKINMPYLFITGSDTPEFEKNEYTVAALKVLLQKTHFEYQIVQTYSHHFHLVEPEKISEVIQSFLQKHYKREE